MKVSKILSVLIVIFALATVVAFSASAKVAEKTTSDSFYYIANDFTLCKPLVKKSYTFVSPTLANYHIFNTVQSLAHFCHNM